MKSFKQYISEDIELLSGHPRTTKIDMEDAQMNFEDDAEYRKNLGKIHKDYSIHRADRNFWITHDPSGKVVGRIDTEPSYGNGSKTIQIAQLNIDKNHTRKKIGHSLPVAAYTHLWRNGYTIHAGDEQSVGAAKVWQDLINNPETRDHVHAIHDPYFAPSKELGPAHRLSSGDIWTSGSGEARRAATRKGIRLHKYSTPEAERAQDVRLILRAKRRAK
jgi:hypothetical protein